MRINKIRFVHFFTDEKFTDGAISLFETDERADNKYYIVCNGDEEGLKYTKSPLVELINELHVGEVSKNADVVFLHSLYCIPFHDIFCLPNTSKVVWFSWGYDLYTADVIVPLRLYGKETLKIISSGSVYKRLLSKYNSWMIHIKYFGKYQKLLSKIDYYSGVFPYEHNLVARYNPFFKAKSLDFYYGSTKFFIPNSLDCSYNANRNNIIIGNSAAITNNHADALYALARVPNLSCDRIIIPLSYGGSKDYVCKIKELGYNLFDSRFAPLDTFMPLKDYLDLISNCKAAIFYLERQQASDNILMQLWYGAKVFLPDGSGMYNALRLLGIKVYSIEREIGEVNTCMSEEDVIANRRILVMHYSSDSMIERIKKINDNLINDLQ